MAAPERAPRAPATRRATSTDQRALQRDSARIANTTRASISRGRTLGRLAACYDAPMSDSYATLVASFTKLYRYQHLAAIAGWDQAAMMPSRGNDARGAAMAEPRAAPRHAHRAAPRARARQGRGRNRRSDRARVGARDGAAVADRKSSTRVARRGRRAWPARAASTRGGPSARPTTGSGFSSTGGQSSRARGRKRPCSPKPAGCRATTRWSIATSQG